MTSERRCPLIVEVARGSSPRRLPVFAAIALVVPLGAARLAWAENADQEKKLPPAEEVAGSDLVTSDGLQLSATFYPGTEGRESVPVVLLHMWKGDRKEYAGLALYLQREKGCAVLVPDLRGHGESTQSPFGGGKLDAAKMGTDQFYLMAYNDMETLRKFLVDRNDKEELNLKKLCIVGAEMGAAVAAYYAAYDWTTPRREADRAAASQDVKALIMISPDWDFKGLPLNKPLANPLVRSQISMMIVAGKEDPKSLADARRVYNLITRYHVDPETAELDQRDLFFGEPPTKLEGTKMLGVKGLNLEPAIARFIELRLVDKPYPWYRRAGKK